MKVATGSFDYGYSPLNFLDSISFLVEACAKVNELSTCSKEAPLYIILMVDVCGPMTMT